MNRLNYFLLISAGAFLLSACANGSSTAEQAATNSASASCGSSTMDGTSHEVASACISGDKEHIRLEGVAVSAGQTLIVYADATDGGGTKGWEFTFHGTSGKIYVKNTVNSEFISTTAYTLSVSDTYCIDIHRGSEDPRHIIIWKGSAKCNQTLANAVWSSGAGFEANFNSNSTTASGTDYLARPVASVGATIGTNDVSMAGGMFTGGANPDVSQGGSKFFYKGPSGSLSKITVKNHLTSGL